MNPSLAPIGYLSCALAAVLLSHAETHAQFGVRTAIGQYYSVEMPFTSARFFSEVQIERVAPHPLAPPAPLAPVPLPVALRALTGQIIENPRRQRLYFTGWDPGGAVRLIRVDLMTREARQVLPPRIVGPPYQVQALVTDDGSKLYVRWFASGAFAETDIYDGETLAWIDRTVEFLPDDRAAGFEHRTPFLWTLDGANQPVLVNTHADRVINVFQLTRALGPVRGVTVDAWRDLLLVRLDTGAGDRFQLVDMVSGEVGPPLDVEGYRRAVPRLALSGRFLILVDYEGELEQIGTRRPTAVATGSGTIFDLRLGRAVDQFKLVVDPQLPVNAIGTISDPALPGRLWISAPGDYVRSDYDLPGCDRKAPGGDRAQATLHARWDPQEPLSYRYRVTVARTSAAGVAAVAVRAGRDTERAFGPDGWGTDWINRDQWMRWTNGLGPDAEDLAPGSSSTSLELQAHAEARPGIVEYRVQAATGLPRGCENDDTFLRNSVAGFTIAPQQVSGDARKLAKRLRELVERLCEIDWIDEVACESLSPTAAQVENSRSDREAAIGGFETALAGANLQPSVVGAMLRDAASAVREALEPDR